jgi:hypothetical protein
MRLLFRSRGGIIMRYLNWVFVASFVLAGTGKLTAQDTVRLGGTGDATVQSLVFDGQAETESVYWRGWGYRSWGYRPYGGFYRPYAYRPYFYRPYAYRPYFYGYGYRPYYAYASSYGYAPYASAYYAPSYYYVPSYSAPVYSDYLNPCTAEEPAMPNAVVLGSSSYTRGPIFPTPPRAPAMIQRPTVRADSNDGTYPYDGGPSQPMPLPGQDGAPALDKKRPTVPLDGTLVSIPSRPARSTFPAYGETALSPRPAQAAPLQFVSKTAGTARVAYPAYGDR